MAGEEHKWKSPVTSLLSPCISDSWRHHLYPSQYSPWSSSPTHFILVLLSHDIGPFVPDFAPLFSPGLEGSWVEKMLSMKKEKRDECNLNTQDLAFLFCGTWTFTAAWCKTRRKIVKNAIAHSHGWIVPVCRLRFKDGREAVTFSNREILLLLTAASRMRGGPRPKMSLSSGLNCTKRRNAHQN